MDSLEMKVVKYCNALGSKRLDALLAFINSVYFLVCFWLVVILTAVLKNPHILRDFFIAVAAVTLMHFIVTEALIKHLGTRWYPVRRRPYVAAPQSIKAVGMRFSDSSFPSSHMATTVAMAVVIFHFYPSLIGAFVALIVLMAFSRLHNGMHYPSDILAGGLLGLAYGQIALKIATMYS